MENKDYAMLLNQMEASSKSNGVASGECSSGRRWKVFITSVHCLVQTLIGGSVCITLWFAFESTSGSAFQLHVALNVIGYQLLIAHGILSLQSSSWSFLSLQHQRRVHVVLQSAGAAFAIAGSSVMIVEKGGQFKTLHSKLALLALILTCASLINGLSSLYAVELRRIIAPKVSKISHMTLATAAFTLSSVSLALGYNKKSFKKWVTPEFATLMICVLVCSTFIIVIPSFVKVLKMFCIFRNAKSKRY